MSKELDDLAKQYQKEKPTVMQKDISIFRSTLTQEAASFLRSVEQECKNERQSTFTLIAVIQRLGK
jgi:uncharacterized damage-inducible protein DinB